MSRSKIGTIACEIFSRSYRILLEDFQGMIIISEFVYLALILKDNFLILYKTKKT